MELKDLFEITGGGIFPEYSHKEIDDALKYLLTDHKQIRQITRDSWLCLKGNTFFILKNEDVVGWLITSVRHIANKDYQHIDMCYIMPQFRNTGAGQWLFYAVKQYSHLPVIADEAISKQGEVLLAKGLQAPLNGISILNKQTGEKRPVDKLIDYNDNECYLFERTQLQLGYNLLPGSDKLDTFYMVFESF